MQTFRDLKELIYKCGRRVRRYWRVYVWLPHLMPRISGKFYRRIRERKSPNSVLLILSHAMGDTLYGMAFAEEYRKKLPADKKLIVVAQENYCDIVRSFSGYDALYLIPPHGWLHQQYRCLCVNTPLAKKALQDQILIAFPGFVQLEAENPDIIYQMRTRIFSIGETAPIHYYRPAPVRVTAIPDFDLGGVHDRVVVFNVCSNSAYLEKEGRHYFTKICDYLNQQGYLVYTNVIKDQLPVPGSRELRCSLPELFAIAQKIPLVVSLRSGILDYLAPSNVSMFVVYNNPEYYKTLRIKSWECGGQYDEMMLSDLLADTDLHRFRTFLDSLQTSKRGQQCNFIES